ncbi:S1/P1 nuclease [Flaviaesturariibacter terrae]
MKKWFLLPLLLLSMSARSWAWGKQGHEMVAEIAFHFLAPDVQQKVLKALGGLSIEEAATWMDDVRANNSFDAMKPWHYIDIEKGKNYEPTADKNALTILNGVISRMSQHASFTGNQQRDLLLLFHLVGDIHQPLHTGYPSDKGGNSVNLDYDGGQVNLHSLWDTRMIVDEKITVADCLNQYATWTPEKADSVRNAGLMSWMNESRTLLPQVYAFNGERIDKTYCEQNKAIVEQQLLTAGLRLARVLERAFGPSA